MEGLSSALHPNPHVQHACLMDQRLDIKKLGQGFNYIMRLWGPDMKPPFSIPQPFAKPSIRWLIGLEWDDWRTSSNVFAIALQVTCYYYFQFRTLAIAETYE